MKVNKISKTNLLNHFPNYREDKQNKEGNQKPFEDLLSASISELKKQGRRIIFFFQCGTASR